MTETHSIAKPFLLRAFLFASLLAFLLTHTAAVHAQEAPRVVVSRIKPEYPALALRMHISGTVLVAAKVRADGTVESVRATSGHAFLQGPAEQAVRQWKFSRSNTSSDATVEVLFVSDSHL